MSYTYKYDRYGNMWQGDGSLSLGLSGGNNQIDASDGYSYDAAGNVTGDGVHTYTYDAENRITKVDGGATAQYVYDAQGRRVRKTVSGSSVNYLYDLSGHVITEVNSSGGWTRGEVFAGGKHIATYAGGTTYFTHADWIGTVPMPPQTRGGPRCQNRTERVRTGVSGAVAETCTSLPFGDSQSCSGSDPSPLHFTGKQRDTETGLDDFNARYYASTAGRPDAFTDTGRSALSEPDRFMSPDWSAKPQGIPYGQLGDPQSLNLYVYVRDNPITGLDIDGHAAGQTPTTGTQCNQSKSCTTRGENSDHGDAKSGTPAQERSSVATVGAAVGAVSGAVVGAIVGATGGATVGTLAEPGGGTIVGGLGGGAEGAQAGAEIGAVAGAALGAAIGKLFFKGHAKGPRESSRERHEKGQGRRLRDRAGEKGDVRRRERGMYPRKRPSNWKGPWPPH